MDPNVVATKVKNAFVNCLGIAPERITPETTCAELGVVPNSAEQIEILLSLEEDFEVDVSDAKFEAAPTFKDVVALMVTLAK